MTTKVRARPTLVLLNLVPLCSFGAVGESIGTTLPEAMRQGLWNKSQYHLFNPVPRALLREMNPDRPDKTEGPFTVDAGHFQLEMDLATYTYDRYNVDHTDSRAESVAIAPVNFRVGLLNNLDLHLLVQTYESIRIRNRTTGAVEKHRGFGDVLVRAKLNCWGNDGGTTAFGIMPFFKLPSNQDQLGNRHIEGGLVLPLTILFADGWGLGLMSRVDFSHDEGGRGYHSEFINSISFSHDLVGKLAGYVEFFSQVSTETKVSWIGTADVGLTYNLTENLQLDAGVNIGLTRAADDLNPFVGVSVRF